LIHFYKRAMKPRAAGKKEIGDPSLGERVGRGEVLDPGEVVCPICMCILLDPVEMPCKHTICTPCYEETVTHSQISCPVCRCRLSSWSRQAFKTNTLINKTLDKYIKEKFSAEVAARLDGKDTIDPEEYFPCLPNHQFAKEGEIKSEFDVEMARAKREQEEAERKEEQKSMELIKKLQAEYDREMNQTLQDEEFARSLFNTPSPGKENIQKSRQRRRTGPLDSFLVPSPPASQGLGSTQPANTQNSPPQAFIDNKPPANRFTLPIKAKTTVPLLPSATLKMSESELNVIKSSSPPALFSCNNISKFMAVNGMKSISETVTSSTTNDSQESQSLLAGDDYTLWKIDKFKAETVDSNESQNLICGSSLISPASGRYRREETFTSSSTYVGSLSLGGDSTKLTPSQTYMAVNRARKRVETATSSSRDDSQESLSSQRQDIPQVKSVNTINRTASSSNGDVKIGNPLNQADLRETFCDRKLETEDIVASNPSSKQKLQLNVDLWPSPDDIEFDDEPASPILSKTPSPSFVFKKSEREFEKSLFGKESELNKLNNIDTESQSCEEKPPSLSLASEKQEDLSEFKSIMDSFEADGLDSEFVEAQRLMELKLQQEMKDLEVARLLQEQLDQEQRPRIVDRRKGSLDEYRLRDKTPQSGKRRRNSSGKNTPDSQNGRQMSIKESFKKTKLFK